jgi:hypothetical protein
MKGAFRNLSGRLWNNDKLLAACLGLGLYGEQWGPAIPRGLPIDRSTTAMLKALGD